VGDARQVLKKKTTVAGAVLTKCAAVSTKQAGLQVKMNVFGEEATRKKM
jgi:hypothetical protein